MAKAYLLLCIFNEIFFEAVAQGIGKEATILPLKNAGKLQWITSSYGRVNQ